MSFLFDKNGPKMQKECRKNEDDLVVSHIAVEEF